MVIWLSQTLSAKYLVLDSFAPHNNVVASLRQIVLYGTAIDGNVCNTQHLQKLAAS